MSYHGIISLEESWWQIGSKPVPVIRSRSVPLNRYEFSEKVIYRTYQAFPFK